MIEQTSCLFNKQNNRSMEDSFVKNLTPNMSSSLDIAILA